MIELKHLSFSYEDGQTVLDDLNVTIHDHEKVGLIGANGAGKSTLMKLLLGLLTGEGEILVDDLPLNARHLSAIRQKIGFVLQNSDNQMFMPTVYEDMIFGPLNYGVPRDEADKRVDTVLKTLGLTHLKHRPNHKISGGEKRMAAIATILAMHPSIILMDEPSTALDPFNRRTVIRAIQSLDETRLIASHDLDMILETCDRVILLGQGRIVADGPVREILSDRTLLEQNRMELPLGMQTPGMY